MADRGPALGTAWICALNGRTMTPRSRTTLDSLKVLYVSYDGLMDPLGASQIAPYVQGLASKGHEYTLMTFEKAENYRDPRRWVLAETLRSIGIRWLALSYHRRPRLPATALDLWNGWRAVRKETGARGTDLIHCRGDVAMVMARASDSAAPLVYDKRGFFADERCEVGSWRRGGAIDRAVRRVEETNLSAADGLVVLTEAARRILLERGATLPPTRVIPTSVDLSRFTPGSDPPSFGLSYVGSLGTWYLTDGMVALARESASLGMGRPLFVTNQPAEARAAGATSDWAEVVSAPHHEVPAWLRRCAASFFLIRPSFAKRASCPTKLGEALACGLPVLANAGVGDVADLIEEEHVGVVVDDSSPTSLRQGINRLKDLLADPGCRRRCRQVAVRRFALGAAVDAYDSLYREALKHRATRRAQ